MPRADTLKLYETLRREFEEKKSAVIAEAIEAALETHSQDLETRLVTGTDFREENARLRAEVKVSIAEVKAEIIRWMFVFWVGQSAATFALLKLIR